MRPVLPGLGSLILCACLASDASAAWDNVFQPTLFGRNRQPQTSLYVAPAVVYSSPAPSVSYYAPVSAAAPSGCASCNVAAPAPAQVAAAAPAPQTCCSTNYQQRCFYQPVTTYETKTYYEPVTTTQTSYYYEPVTSYRYSTYYCPNSCSYKQTATPVTSYELRAQSCPVQSWVQRCAQVPVTTYQKSCYLQPQTTCNTTTSTTTVGALIPMSNVPQQEAPPSLIPAQAQPSAVPSISQPATSTPPSVDQSRSPGSPSNSGSTYDRFYPPQTPIKTTEPPTMPPASWQPSPTPAFPTQAPAMQPRAVPSVKLERIAFDTTAPVEGQVLRGDQSPRANVRLHFVSASTGQRHFAETNSKGRFHVELESGAWLVYVEGADNVAQFANRLDVSATRTAPVTLVSR